MTGGARFSVGFLVGSLLFGVLALGMRGDETAVTAATAATTAAVEPVAAPWFEDGETMLGATAILPRGLSVEDGIARFEYDLAGLAPTLGIDDGRPDLAVLQGDYLAAPEHWVLKTTSGQSIEVQTGPQDTSVRFELPAADAEVASVSVVGWRVAVPFGEQVELTIEEGAVESTRRGTVTIDAVLYQSISTIVQIHFDRIDDPWQAGVELRPVDTRWRTAGRQGGGLQLIWDGADAPATVVLEDAGFEMRPMSGDFVVLDEAGLR